LDEEYVSIGGIAIDEQVKVASRPVLNEATIQGFKASLLGKLILPEDPNYNSARKVWNGMIDKYPALIARCLGVGDIIKAVKFARANQLLVAVRGGGHNVSGNAVCDGGLVIDLSCMKGIRVDPIAQTARAEPGVTWGEIDQQTQAFGLALPGGIHSTTGIAGLTLGGGYGYLSRKYGLTIDSLLSADIVTATGQFLTASKTDNPDLFWGIRGGGGNFGIVTSFEFKLHPVGPMVLSGMLLHPLTKAKDLMRSYREFIATAPDELYSFVNLMTAPYSSQLPTHIQGTPVMAIVLCYVGPIEDGERMIRPLRAIGPPEVDLVLPRPYVELQSMLNAGHPPGCQNYWKSEYLMGLSDEAIYILIDHVSRKPSPRSKVIVVNLLGAVRRVNDDETPYNHRAAPFILNINSTWSDTKENEKNIKWARDLWKAVQPFSTGGVYVNFLMNEGIDRVIAAYGKENFERLKALKNKYDPTNFFSLNQNIRPS
jgi:hypothetical protein